MDDRLFPIENVKRCSKCREVKPLHEFNRLRKANDGRQSYCRDCNKAYHYRNWDKHMAQIRARRVRSRQEAREFIVGYLRDHPCVDCGETDVVVLEFDHLRDKTSNVSNLIGSGQLKRLKREIEKCEVVCANCHRRRTARRGDWYRHRVQ
jgi:hypothetical protein